MTQDMNETNFQGWTDGQRNGQCENKTGWQTLQVLIRLCSDDGLQCFDWSKILNQVYGKYCPRVTKTIVNFKDIVINQSCDN